MFASSLLMLLGCPPPVLDDPTPHPEADADVFVDALGDPIPGLDADTLAKVERGREVMERGFTPATGLGPTFNTDSCAGCHQFPVAGGSGPRYRDFFLVKTERWDGALVDAGTNGTSPVRNLYTLHAGELHVAEPIDTVVYARRNTPSGLGIGLFAFVADDTILANADPDDLDGDGISGRANYEQNRVGRFGYKSQASSLESFNRGAMFNQMGLTSNPLFYTFPESPEQQAALLEPTLLGSRVAHAQVSAPGEPTLDDDDVPDPELSDADQEALLLFSTYLGVPRPGEVTPRVEAGAQTFEDIGCADCHIPRLDSTIGPLPGYTDLLLHDMGEAMSDGVGPGLSTGPEFRTQPLWGVQLHGPFLHDGRADTLAEAIAWHGGEAEPSAERWADLSDAEQAQLIAFLEALGGYAPDQQVLIQPGDAPPQVGESGGPDRDLAPAELELWLEGRALFDRSMIVDDGLGPYFNADSCRACHQDPVLGGAGGVDTNVIRVGHRDPDTGAYSSVGFNALPRVTVWGNLPLRLPDEVNLIEGRNPPSALGVGPMNDISAAAILAGEDPDDLDGDGISGRAHVLSDGQIGRFGWKAQVPSALDFAADALLNEIGLTIDPALSDFTGTDTDDLADPELPEDRAVALAFYLERLGPPQPGTPDDPAAAEAGEALFASLGCQGCHVPELDGVPLYSDLLLHDVSPDPMASVEQDPGVLPGEYRTPPLWGVGATAPYLHDGRAFTLEDALLLGHFGEAEAARLAFEGLSAADQEAVVAFLQGL
ncbi:MAG: hypothetical protein H6739_07700 [Alphaproteobacteria bacterium]|nr:hypothetical protein [Alphaproteobacteria bacterium]